MWELENNRALVSVQNLSEREIGSLQGALEKSGVNKTKLVQDSRTGEKFLEVEGKGNVNKVKGALNSVSTGSAEKWQSRQTQNGGVQAEANLEGMSGVERRALSNSLENQGVPNQIRTSASGKTYLNISSDNVPALSNAVQPQSFFNRMRSSFGMGAPISGNDTRPLFGDNGILYNTSDTDAGRANETTSRAQETEGARASQANEGNGTSASDSQPNKAGAGEARPGEARGQKIAGHHNRGQNYNTAHEEPAKESSTADRKGTRANSTDKTPPRVDTDGNVQFSEVESKLGNGRGGIDPSIKVVDPNSRALAQTDNRVSQNVNMSNSAAPRGARAGAMVGLAMGARDLYKDFSDPNSSHMQDLAAGGARQAAAVIKTGADVTGILGGVGEIALHTQQVRAATTVANSGSTALARSAQAGQYLDDTIRILDKVDDVAKAGGKWAKRLPVIGTVTTIVAGAAGGVSGYLQGDGHRVAKSGGGTIGALAGGAAGAKAGATAGAAVGALFGGIGAGPGAVVGGIVGGIGGALAGAWAGGEVLDAAVGDAIHNNERYTRVRAEQEAQLNQLTPEQIRANEQYTERANSYNSASQGLVTTLSKEGTVTLSEIDKAKKAFNRNYYALMSDPNTTQETKDQLAQQKAQLEEAAKARRQYRVQELARKNYTNIAEGLNETAQGIEASFARLNEVQSQIDAINTIAEAATTSDQPITPESIEQARNDLEALKEQRAKEMEKLAELERRNQELIEKHNDQLTRNSAYRNMNSNPEADLGTALDNIDSSVATVTSQIKEKSATDITTANENLAIIEERNATAERQAETLVAISENPSITNDMPRVSVSNLNEATSNVQNMANADILDPEGATAQIQVMNDTLETAQEQQNKVALMQQEVKALEQKLAEMGDPIYTANIEASQHLQQQLDERKEALQAEYDKLDDQAIRQIAQVEENLQNELENRYIEKDGAKIYLDKEGSISKYVDSQGNETLFDDSLNRPQLVDTQGQVITDVRSADNLNVSIAYNSQDDVIITKIGEEIQLTEEDDKRVAKASREEARDAGQSRKDARREYKLQEQQEELLAQNYQEIDAVGISSDIALSNQEESIIEARENLENKIVEASEDGKISRSEKRELEEASLALAEMGVKFEIDIDSNNASIAYSDEKIEELKDNKRTA